MRKIIQVAAAMDADIPSPALYALCADATVWVCDGRHWFALPAIPQTTSLTDWQPDHVPGVAS